jgi:hypothetical protein
MVRSEEQGALVIGADGLHNLDTGEVEGHDPLEPFGPHAVVNLRRLDGYEHVGDILVISMYDPSTDEIAPFEHQVGAHGGLGGMQTKAFVMYPSVLAGSERPVALVGAEQVNGKIREWIARAHELEAGGFPSEAEVEPGPDTLPSVLRRPAAGNDRPTAA